MIPFFKVEYQKLGQTLDLTPYILSIQISKGTEAKKNSLTIELQNHDGILNTPNGDVWEVDQSQITIWAGWEPIDTATQDPLMVSLVSTFDFPMDNNGKYKLKVKCTDKTALFLSKMWAEAITESTNFNASEAVINIVGHINDLDADETNDLTTTNVATTKSDGTDFQKPIVISKVWKPAYEWLDDLSQIEFTGEDRSYVYYVDANNDLHWNYPYQKTVTSLTSGINSTVTTIPVSSTSGYPDSGTILIDDELILYSSKTSNSFLGCTRGYQMTVATSHVISSVVSGNYLQLGRQNIYKMDINTTEEMTYNFIIYNAGKTPAGYEYLDYHLDESQVGKKFKMKFMEMKSISDALYQQERLFGVWGPDKTTDYPEPNGNPLSGGNTYTMTFKDSNGDAIVVTSNDEYQDQFELRLKQLAEAKCETYFRSGQQKYKATIQMRGTLEYEPNELVNIINPKSYPTSIQLTADYYNQGPQNAFGRVLNLRIKEIKHQFNKGSWITDISAESDGEPRSST